MDDRNPNEKRRTEYDSEDFSFKLVLDSMRAHVTDSVKRAIKRINSIPAVIPGYTTKYLQPLDITVNRALKVALQAEWEAWMICGDKSYNQKWPHAKSNFCPSVPVDPDNVGEVSKSPPSPTGF